VIIKADSDTMTNNNERQYERHKRQNKLQITFKDDKTNSNERQYEQQRTAIRMT